MGRSYARLLLALMLITLAGCSGDDDGTTGPGAAGTPFEVAATAGSAYLADRTQCPGLITAQELQAARGTVTIVDLRDHEEYDAGHIPGAFHASLPTLLDDLATTIPAGSPYVLTSATGQRAAYAKLAMELVGYDQVRVLEYGMSAWHETIDRWTEGIGDGLTDPEIANRNDELVEHPFPDLGALDPSSVVDARVRTMLAGGYRSVRWQEIQDDPTPYFVVNYFEQMDYEATGVSGSPGHIPGAYQFTPYASLGLDQQLRFVPPDRPVVVYGWTGQHAAQVAAYLNLLGYDAYNLEFGANGLFHGQLTAHAWDPEQPETFDLETLAGATPIFDALARAAAAYLDDPDRTPGLITAQELHDRLEEFTVVDLRPEAEYLAGHIGRAYLASLATLRRDLSTTIPSHRPYVLVSRTGEVASYAKMAMEMMGYDDVRSLDFGISGWTPEADWMTGAVGDGLVAAETEGHNHELTAHDFPALDDYAMATVIDDRTDALIEAGYPAVTWDEVSATIDDYFVLCYMDESDYAGQGPGGAPGHIPGAFQFTPHRSLGIDSMLVNVPFDQPVLVYDWTGQHAAQVTAYLNLLDYDARNLRLGANALFHSALTERAWTPDLQQDFELTTILPPTASFTAMADAVAGFLNDPAASPGLIRAAELAADLDSYTVVDLRPFTHYQSGHIPGSIQSSLADLPATLAALPADAQIVFVDYTGQWSGHARTAAALLGRDARALAYGISAWSTSLDRWSRQTGNGLAAPETENQNDQLVAQDFPALAAYTPGDVVGDRIAETLSRGYRGVDWEVAHYSLDSYFIINYMNEDDYEGRGSAGVPGHIGGAYQFTPHASLALDQMLETLPADRPILVYGWDGQLSSQVVFCLNALGYDAWNLEYGANALFYDSLTDHRWGPDEQNDFPLDSNP